MGFERMWGLGRRQVLEEMGFREEARLREDGVIVDYREGGS